LKPARPATTLARDATSSRSANPGPFPPPTRSAFTLQYQRERDRRVPSYPLHLNLRPLVFLLLGAGFAFVSRAAPATAIDWPAFLSRQDLIWAQNPAAWEEAAFIGNGNLGASIYVQDGALAWEVNRTDVYHASSRYPMGRVAIKTAGRITGGELRLDLWQAEARGTLRTDRGEIRWRSFTSTEPAVIVIECEGTGGETAVDATWIAAPALPPSEVYRKQPIPPGLQHPAVVVQSNASDTTSMQAFKDGGAFAVSLHRADASPVSAKKIFYLAVGSEAKPATALSEATAATASAAALGLERVTAGHRAWWHAYYPASFVSFPDARLEAFYWIQIYKLGSAMRADGPVLDLMGPWFRTTPWPRIWWNLNIQLTYAPLMSANRLPLAESLFRHLDRHRDQLHANAPAAIRADAAVIGRSSGPDMARGINLAAVERSDAGSEAGNLPWVMFLYWSFYRAQMDDTILRDRVLPLLIPTIGHYLAYVEKDAAGLYHLPRTHSPEFATVPDTNYDLALFRWGLQTLIASCAHLRLDDPHLPRWRDVLAHLTPPPVDATGLMIGRNRDLDQSHRHYSHLLSIYPLHLLTPEKPADRALIETSLDHWVSAPAKHRGYSHTGAGSIYEILGEGDPALVQLHKLLDDWIKPNTMYTEAGPVIETPLSALNTVHEMFLQDWGGKLRVFPAVPSTWPDASFATLRADGAFLVSGVRRAGRTAWIKIESLAGEPCHVVVRDWSTAVIRETSPGVKPAITVTAPGEFTATLPKNSWVLFAADTAPTLPNLSPVATPIAAHNPYPQHYK
jgi:alpha-L-fucosidase 2